MKYYLILSDGAYSDYSPTYYTGSKEIKQEEFDKKGKEVGDLLYKKFEDGEVKHRYILSSMWFKEMENWIKEQGFEELPDNIPEINVAYSEMPHN